MNTDLIKEFQILGGRVFVAQAGAKDLVSIEGSVLGGPNFLPKERAIVSDITADLLDAGTKKKSKNVIREGLASRGANLSFNAIGDRTYFSASCFPEDVPYLLATAAECLGEAAFPEAEVAAEKKRALGNLLEAKTDTRTQARIAFSQALYDAPHPNYAKSLNVLETQAKTLGRRDIAGFGELLGKGGLVIALAGDIKPQDACRAVESAFNRAPAGSEAGTVKKANAKEPKATETLIHIPDKANIDVYLGAALALTKQHELYHPTHVLAEMLGGGFASHLIQTIRERDGLTYGIYAGLGGLNDGTDGYLRIWATFSPALYKKSIDTVRQELTYFFKKKITPGGLAKKKEEITGSYLVGLSTTRGLATALHAIGADGRDLSYLWNFPEIIKKVSLAEVKDAASLIPLSKLSLAAAGTFPKK